MICSNSGISADVIQRRWQLKPYSTSVSLRERSPLYIPLRLWHHHMRLIQHHQVTAGHEVQQRPGRCTRRTLVQMARIVFNARYRPHLYISMSKSVRCSRRCASSNSPFPEILQAVFQLNRDISQHFLHSIRLGDIMFRCRPPGAPFFDQLAGGAIEARDASISSPK